MATPDGQESKFEDTPTGNAQRWQMEFTAARKEVDAWHRQGETIEKRYLDERGAEQQASVRWNLFTANVNTQKAMLYGKTPSVTVSRKFDDSDDDVARVAGEMAERLLNEDILKPEDGYASAVQHGVLDWLLVGMSNSRCRYVFEEDPGKPTPAIMGKDPETGADVEEAPAVPAMPSKADEEVETLYVHWKDQLWSPSRIFEEARWWAFQAQMSRDELVKRFGKEVGGGVPLNSKRGGTVDELDSRKSDPWGRANVWEVWCKEDKKVYWVVEGYHRTLDEKPDPLGLEDFWPFPRPIFANLTNSKLVPRPDFVLAQDLYDEVDTLSTRIRLLVDAVAVRGVYDATAGEVQKLLQEGASNLLIPVSNWAMFGDKGGLRGVIDWFPLDMVVAAITQLCERRVESQAALFQVTGMSDIVRGQATTNTTATEQSIKAKFASVRLQYGQDEIARYASDIQRIRFEIICKHYDANTIIERSNILNTPDAPLAQQAVQLLKDKHACYRIQVKPESISLTDYAAVKQERTEVVAAIAQYVQVAGPLAMSAPQLGPMLLKVLQWMVSGLKGASEIEGVIDQAIAQVTQAAQQPKPPPPPDPKMQTEAFKAQAAQQHTQMELQADLVRTHAETQASAQQEADKARIGAMADANKQRNQVLADIGRATGGGGGA